jgi:hypothetical protein
MAVVTTKTAAILALDGTPIAESTKGEGAPFTPKHHRGRITAVSGDSIASKYVFARVPSLCIVENVRVENDAVTGAAMDVGVYFAHDSRHISPGQTAGAVIDADFFATAFSVATANTATGGVDVTDESGAYTLAKREQPLWQALGLASDPGGKFDIVGTLTAAATAGGDIMLRVSYVE